MKSVIREETWWWILMVVSFMVYVVGIPVNIMEPDATTYAVLSMEMMDRGNWFITAQGQDWLDKPHLQFWITAFSLKIFGVNNFGFKLPAILFTIIGAFYTFRFGKHFYSSRHGYLAVLLLLCSLHLILSNNDVRAEPFLLAGSIFSLFQFARYLEKYEWKYLVLGTIGLSFLLMTKGLFTILPIAGAIFFHLLYKARYREIFHWRWLAAGALTLVFTLPVIIAYYMQFDLHPEKEIFGETNVSGVRFFFWDSQWGRFTNSGPIKGQGDPFFFLHTILWAFAPWAFVFFFGMVQTVKRLFKKSLDNEDFTFWGILFMLAIFSLSKFQLPHYIVPLFPFFAIISAGTLLQANPGKWVTTVHLVSAFILVVAAILLQYFFSGSMVSLDTFVLGLVLAVLSDIAFRQGQLYRAVLPAAFSLMFVMYYLNRDFYPSLLKYQSESVAAAYIQENGIPKEDLVITGRLYWWALDFYLHQSTPIVQDVSKLAGKYVFLDEKSLELLNDSQIAYEIVAAFEDFHVTSLTLEFIDRATRAKATTTNYLVKVAK